METNNIAYLPMLLNSEEKIYLSTKSESALH